MMKLLVLILGLCVSRSVSYKCKEDDEMNNRSCWMQLSAAVGEYQNITTWLKPTQSSIDVVITDTLFALHNRTIKLGKNWFVVDTWNKVDLRVQIKEIIKSNYELRYFIDDSKLEVIFPFETDMFLQRFFGVKWKFNGLWNISTTFPCLNSNFSSHSLSFNTTNTTSIYNGTVPCSLSNLSGSFPIKNITGNNVNKNCSYDIGTKSNNAQPTKPCPTSILSKPRLNISNTISSSANLTKSNAIVNVTQSCSCPNDSTLLTNFDHLKNKESHTIIYIALVFMLIGAISLVAGFLQYRKALQLMKGGDYEEFQNDSSQIGTLETDSERVSYGSYLSQRMQYNELIDQENLQVTVPEPRNTRNFSLSSELEAEDLYNPMISPSSR